MSGRLNLTSDPPDRTRIVASRLRPKGSAMVSVVLACVLLLAGLGGALLARSLARSFAQTDLLPRAAAREPPHVTPPDLLGRWVGDGENILVSRSGAVWADNGGLLGEGSFDGRDASRFLFVGTTFRCAYRLTFDGPDETDWSLIDRSPGTPCPTGRFRRRFGF